MLGKVDKGLKTVRDHGIAPIADDIDQARIGIYLVHQAHRPPIQQAARAFIPHDAFAFQPGFTLQDEIGDRPQHYRREVFAAVPAVAVARQPVAYLFAGYQRFEQRGAGEEMRLVVAMHFGVQADQPRQ